MTIAGGHPEPTPVGQKTTADGTNYWVWGTAGAETTVVAVHGFRGDHHGLLPIVARMPGIRVVTPDLPGFGASAALRRGQHDVANYARWLTEFVADPEVNGSSRLMIMGHSFGSVICAAAVAEGLRPEKLILINPIAAPALEGPRGILSRIAVGYYEVGARLPAVLGEPLLSSRLIVRGLSEVMATTDDPGLRRWIHDQHRRYFSGYANRQVVVEAFQASVSHHVGEYAEELIMPTLLVGGDRDDIVPVGAQRRLAERLPNGRLVVLSPVGHLVHYEQPEAAALWINEFLAAQPGLRTADVIRPQVDIR